MDGIKTAADERCDRAGSTLESWRKAVTIW
jgi:hypothetical protein